MPRNTEIPEKDYGEPLQFDPTFKGPLNKRSCTDVICLLFFIVALVVWGGVSWYAITNGDVRRILAPTDSKGQKCGLDSNVIDKPYLVFFDITKCLDVTVPLSGCPTKQVCVKSCPSETFIYPFNVTSDTKLEDIKHLLVCSEDPTSMEDFKMKIEKNICAKDVYKSESVSHRCLPDIPELANLNDLLVASNQRVINITDIENAINNIKELGNNVIEDLVNSRWSILIALVIVMIICFIYIIIMRWIAGPVIWFSIVGAIAGLGYSIYLSYVRYAYLKDHPAVVQSGNTNLKDIGKSLVSLKETWLVILIVASIALIIILLMVIFLRKRIVIAIALIKEGSKAVNSVKSTIFFPIFPWIFQCLFVALAVVIGLYLYTIGDPNYRAYVNGTQCNSCPYTTGSICIPETFLNACTDCPEAFCHFVGITNYPMINWFIAVDIVVFFWTIFFLDGFGQMVLASTFATWYWTFKKSNVPFFTLTAGIGRTMRYHLGTIAFGSLIITICRVIRLCLEYIDHKVKKFDNAFTRAILCCMRCFFKCLESFLKFINKNAYIMCAVHGKSFFPSARDAFSLLMRNILRVFVLDKVSDFLFFLSKLVVAIGCGVGAYFAFSSPELYKISGQSRLHYDMVPAIIIGISAYFIASVFFNVYAMAVDTLFLCFLEDCERNDGSNEKPYYMSKELMRILGKKNKKMK